MRLPAAVLAALLLLAVLVLPAGAGLLRPTPEWPAMLLVLLLAGMAGRAVVTGALLLLALHKIADLGMAAALGRPFNIVADLALLPAAVELVMGSFGALAAIGSVLAALLGTTCVAAALWWATGQWARIGLRRGLGLIAALSLLVLPVMTPQPGAARYALARAELARDTMAALHRFRDAARHDPMAGRAGLLGAIDRDVLVIFVESYGRASIDSAFYAERHLSTLRRAQERLRSAGLAMRSGFLTSPTQGGQSWLAHATVANGLRIGDQALYQAALASGRQGLFHYARRAGFRTAAVMPAITRPWPEAASMGFDRVLAAGDLGYRGPAFNWVTMPDQYTLAAADRLLRDGGDPPLFAQIVLISSHAPWVPVPHLIGWDQVGDGTGFAAMARAGPSPQQVWRVREDVRRHYRDALDYALQVVMEYALRQAGDPPLIIVMGDHPAAQTIAPQAGRDVPIHVIGPQHLVARSAAWGLTPGLIPAATPAIPMQQLRDLMLQSFAAAP